MTKDQRLFGRQLAEATLEKAALGLLPHEAERALVGGPRLRKSAQSPAEFSSHGMSEMIVGQLAARQNAVDQRQAL